jgi:hypothetical protein
MIAMQTVKLEQPGIVIFGTREPFRDVDPDGIYADAYDLDHARLLDNGSLAVRDWDAEVDPGAGPYEVEVEPGLFRLAQRLVEGEA